MRSPRRTIRELARNAEMYGMMFHGRHRRGDKPGRFVESQPAEVRESLKALKSDDVLDLLPLTVWHR